MLIDFKRLGEAMLPHVILIAVLMMIVMMYEVISTDITKRVDCKKYLKANETP